MIPDIPQDILDRLNVLHLEPLKQFRFAVQIDGLSGYTGAALAGFNEVLGLEESVQVRAVPEGGRRRPHQFPRSIVPTTLTLVRGMTYSRALWNWYQEVVNWDKNGQSYLKDVSVLMIDSLSSQGAGRVDFEAWRFDISKAWPSAWSGPRPNSMSENIAFESLVLTHDGITEGENVLSGRAGELASLLQ